LKLLIMPPVNIQHEIEAVASYLKLLEAAEECRSLHDRAGKELPGPLLRFLGEMEPQADKLLSSFADPEKDRARNATRPSFADEGWISIKASEASPTTVALAILRDEEGPIKAKNLAEKVHAILPYAVGGSIYNLLNRLKEQGDVTQGEDGWRLENQSSAGVLSQSYLWAPIRILSKQDIAAHRREAIIHVLRRKHNLPVMDLVRELLEWKWVKAPANKDLLKLDMAVLKEEGKVRRVGNSRNWELVE
jgi:hypothetical protein